MNLAEKIIDYDMDAIQTKALRLCLIWNKLMEKEFPDYATNKLSKNGDPRKAYVFKIFLKLAKETDGILSESDYELYILAQLQILKSIEFNNVHALIEPTCVNGEKAWRRWKLWQSKYNDVKKQIDAKVSVVSNVKPEIHVNRIMITQQIKSSFAFICKSINGEPTVKSYEDFIKSGLIKKWVGMERISPYFIVYSKNIKSAFANLGINPKTYFSFDYSLFERTINADDGIKDKLRNDI